MKDRSYENFISNHVNRILVNSKMQFQYMKKNALHLDENASLWCGIIQKMVSDMVSEEQLCLKGCVFSGPDGCGKHSAAMLGANYLAEKYEEKHHSCGFIYISGNDMDFDENIVKEDFEYRKSMDFIEGGYPLNIAELCVDKLTNIILERLDYDEKSCVIIVMDDDEQGTFWNKLCQSVAFYSLEYNRDPELPDMFVFVVTKETSRVPHCLRRSLNIIHMNYPDAGERKKMIDKRIYDPELSQLMLRQTEGMGFDDLKEMIEEIWYYRCSQEEKRKENGSADMNGNEDQAYTDIISRLAESIRYKPASASGGTDPSAMLTAFEKMGESISKNMAANTPKQLSLNEMPEELKQAGNENLQRVNPAEIRENAANQTWRDFLNGMGLNLDEDSEKNENT